MTRPHRRRAFFTARPTLWSALVPVVALTAGLLFAASSTAAGGGSLRDDSDSIAERVRAGTRENQELTRQLDALQQQVDALSATTDAPDESLAILERRAQEAAEPAGRVDVTGDALEVRLDDSPLRGDQIPKGFTLDQIVVHQQDVQAVVNALWAGGAEAMMLMDQRVISTSAVRCVGNTLILKGRVYSPPYTITAIGDIDGMRFALAKDPQLRIYREYVEAVGMGYELREKPNSTFPAYAGSIVPQYARALP